MMRKRIIQICILCCVLFVGVLCFLYKDQKVAVLGYHNFLSHEEKKAYPDPMILEVETFERQLKYLKENGYHALSLDEFYCWMQKKCSLPRKSVLITMDDGYLSNYQYAFPLLQKYKMRAVVFVIGSRIEKERKAWTGNPDDYLSSLDIEESKKKYPNIEFASHSYDLHHQEDITNKTYQALLEDIEQQQQIIQSDYYAYPYGKVNQKMVRALKEKGYKMAFTFGPKEKHRKATQEDDFYHIPRLNISNDLSFFKFKLRLWAPV